MYEKELAVAKLAVQRASLVAKLILKDYSTKLSAKTITKSDASPVTIADFAAQSVIISSVKHHFPKDEFIAEESSTDLVDRKDLLDLILRYVSAADAEFATYKAQYTFAPLRTQTSVLEALSAGNGVGGDQGRCWILDPIDGTKGFLRNGQFSLCLGLMDRGTVRVGVNGCPNLPTDIEEQVGGHDFDAHGAFEVPHVAAEQLGLLFSCREAHGAFVQKLYGEAADAATAKQIHMRSSPSLSSSVVVEGVETKHSDHQLQSAIKQSLGIPESRTIRMDSQVKYCMLALGAADLYLRLPVDASYREKVWDHSSGWLLVKEAGGKVSDMTGADLDFTKGKYLTGKGIIAGSLAAQKAAIGVVAKL